jgi:hypothetical protein
VVLVQVPRLDHRRHCPLSLFQLMMRSRISQFGFKLEGSFWALALVHPHTQFKQSTCNLPSYFIAHT